MNTEQIGRLSKDGLTPRQIAKQLGCSRKAVEDVLAEKSSVKQARNSKRILLTLLTLVAVGVVAFGVNNLTKDLDNLEVYKNVVKVANGLATTKVGNSWFVGDSREPRDQAGIEAEIALIERLTARVNKTLNDNSDVRWVKEQQEAFAGHLMPAIFTSMYGGTTRTISYNLNLAREDPKRLEVVFYGHGEFNHPRINHKLLFYDPSWKSLFVAALRFSDDKWYDAILAHELFHALAHRKGEASATARFLSDEWIGEELQAHDVEAEVLNARTNGAYKQRLRSIVSRIPARSFKDLLMRVRPDDLRELDQLFAPGIPEEVDIRAAEYLLNLSEVWLDINSQGEKKSAKRVEAYRFLIDPRQSTNVR
ncbi:MAG: hypothetical protein WC794_01140 [Candidatus Doudnabacteria bacterium]|jgi:hypothetical protein